MRTCVRRLKSSEKRFPQPSNVHCQEKPEVSPLGNCHQTPGAEGTLLSLSPFLFWRTFWAYSRTDRQISDTTSPWLAPENPKCCAKYSQYKALALPQTAQKVEYRCLWHLVMPTVKKNCGTDSLTPVSSTESYPEPHVATAHFVSTLSVIHTTPFHMGPLSLSHA